MLASIPWVFENRAGQAIFVGQPFLDLTECLNFDLRMVLCSLVHDLGGTEPLSTMNECHLRGESSEEGRFFHGGIPTAHDDDFLVSEECTITGCTGRDASPFLFLLSFNTQPDGLSTCADDDCIGKIFLTFGLNFERSRTEIDTADIAVLDFQAEALSLRP